MPTPTEIPIATTTLGSAASSVSFSSISGSYTDLVIIANFAVTTSTNAYFQLGNGSLDTGNNYSQTNLKGDGTSATSGRRTNNGSILLFNADNLTANEWTTNIINMQNYANTTTYKSSVLRSNSAANSTYATVGLWRSTSAINIITFTSSGNFATGSTFTLYGIAAA